jgi:hypothetical protein
MKDKASNFSEHCAICGVDYIVVEGWDGSAMELVKLPEAYFLDQATREVGLAAEDELPQVVKVQIARPMEAWSRHTHPPKRKWWKLT